jgi:predicted DNA-binding transcriptional regulator YafY
LFEIIQVLRRASRPLTADEIAAELETSRWTIYRDIAALVSQRVPIHGEAGVGYVLRRGFDLPPLMLTSDEVEAVVLGSQWVIANADAELAKAALDVLAKVTAIVPAPLQPAIDHPAVSAAPWRRESGDQKVDLAKLRTWSREGRKLAIRYVDADGATSERTVWPFLVGYDDTTRALMAWCELRRDFRVFLTHRLLSVTYLDQTYPEPRASLRRRWLALEASRNSSRTT